MVEVNSSPRIFGAKFARSSTAAPTGPRGTPIRWSRSEPANEKELAKANELVAHLIGARCRSQHAALYDLARQRDLVCVFRQRVRARHCGFGHLSRQFRCDSLVGK